MARALAELGRFDKAAELQDTAESRARATEPAALADGWPRRGGCIGSGVCPAGSGGSNRSTNHPDWVRDAVLLTIVIK